MMSQKFYYVYLGTFKRNFQFSLGALQCSFLAKEDQRQVNNNNKIKGETALSRIIRFIDPKSKSQKPQSLKDIKEYKMLLQNTLILVTQYKELLQKT